MPPKQLFERPHWYACYTHGRHEKRVEARLTGAGIETYLPLHVTERRWSDRVMKVEAPLFPSYVFGRFRLDQLSQVLGTPGVSTVVRNHGYPTPIDEAELAQLRHVLQVARSHGVEPEVDWGDEGDRVRVVQGVFRGVEGVVAERRGGARLLIRVQAIGRGIAVEISRRDLARITDAGSTSGSGTRARASAVMPDRCKPRIEEK
jgi:transcriptional antiterminator RfaH